MRRPGLIEPTTESGRLLDQRNAARSYGRSLAAAGVATPPRFHLLRGTRRRP